MANEKRLDLIDREKLIPKTFYVEEKSGGHGWVVSLKDISKATAVDAVEVVRCKDCKHWRWSENNPIGKDFGCCVECLMDTEKEHFCSYGERGAK